MVDGQYKTFLVQYRHDGAEWGIQLPAQSFEDAKARLARLAFGTVKGEVVMTLPGSTGPLAAIVTSLRNALRSLAAPPN
jgi:molybdopterin biosynthesis enzyme MoaB